MPDEHENTSREQNSEAGDAGSQESSSTSSKGKVGKAQSARDLREFDVFYKDEVFPDPEAVFRFQPAQIADIKDSAIVVLDTSALLLPYTGVLEQQSIDDIRSTYETLKKGGRLVIPAQAAREFAQNIAKKLAEMYEVVSKRKDTLGKVGGESFRLLESVAVYKELIELESDINEKLRSYKKLVDAVLNHISRWNWDDDISRLYRDLFSDGVVLSPTTDPTAIKTDLERRKTHSIPPGFKDPARDVGDLLIWHAILQVGESRRNDVLFVSGDNKADWRERANSGSVVLYPRYELLDEFRRRSGGKTFQIIPFSQLLDLLGASDSTVQDVKSIEETSDRSQSRPLYESTYSYFDNSQLRKAALQLVQQLRQLIANEGAEENNLRRRHAQALTEARDDRHKEVLEDIHTGERVELMHAMEREYNSNHKVAAMLLRDALLARLPDVAAKRGDVDKWYEHAGSSFFIERIATDLEWLARSLPER